MKELKDLVVGDDVLVTGMYYRRIAKVDKVTKTQIVVDNARYRRNSGWQCGDDIWVVTRGDGTQRIEALYECYDKIEWLDFDELK